jgi:hypothetical protein
MANQISITVDQNVNEPLAQAVDWSHFFHTVEIDAAPAFGSVADPAVDVPPTDGQTDATADDADQPDDGDTSGFAFLVGTGGSDRFELTAGHGEPYAIQDFGDGDKIVLNGFGLDHVTLGLIDDSGMSDTPDANVWFNPDDGAICVGSLENDVVADLVTGDTPPTLRASDFVVV